MGTFLEIHCITCAQV